MSINAAAGYIPEITLGVRLRIAREHTQLDRSAFAERIGIHRDSLAKYETDRATPRPPVLSAWAFASGVDLEWLRTGVRPDPRPTGGGSAFFLWNRRPEQDSNLQPTGYAVNFAICGAAAA